MKFLYSILFITLLAGNLFAQKQGNQWYFGDYAGLDFNSGAPVPILNSKLLTNEGCASIADKTTGNLLFYTDGSSVWDANDSVMPNGTGLGGSYSTTQSAVIVPKPGSSTIYYIFTLDDQAGFFYDGDGGLNCNIVDMSLRGGLGDVTTLDSLMLTPTTEKFGTTLDCDGTDEWVVVHQWNSSAFYAYLITANGISAPVISYSGTFEQDVGSGQDAETIGYMRISTDGKKLALACNYDLDIVQIFDFDNSTGVVSNPITDADFPNYSGEDGPYGVCFSPDNSRLYVSYYANLPTDNIIYQYNMLLPDSAIIASRTIVGVDDSTNLGALQQAPDGKIYAARFLMDSLGTITEPDSLGAACNYVANGVYLDSLCIYGLPDIIPHYINNLVRVQPLSPFLCSGQSVSLIASGGATSYTWSPAATLSSSTGDSVVASPLVTTTYTVTGTNSAGCEATITDTIFVLEGVNVPVITQDGNVLITSSTSDNQWFRNDSILTGETGRKDTATVSGWYKVEAINPSNGCNTVSDSIYVNVSGIAPLSINGDQLSVYPNPTTGEIILTISPSAEDVKDWNLQITDVLGRLVYAKSSLNNNNNIDLSDFSNGVYFITIMNKMSRVVVPVARQN